MRIEGGRVSLAPSPLESVGVRAAGLRRLGNAPPLICQGRAAAPSDAGPLVHAEPRGAGGGAGTLTITGVNNFHAAATSLTSEAGLSAAGQSFASALGLNGLNSGLSNLVSNSMRFMSAPPMGRAPPAVGKTYDIVVDGGPVEGSVMVLTSVPLGNPSGYFYSSLSGRVKITALSVTSVDLQFTDATLTATAGAAQRPPPRRSRPASTPRSVARARRRPGGSSGTRCCPSRGCARRCPGSCCR